LPTKKRGKEIALDRPGQDEGGKEKLILFFAKKKVISSIIGGKKPRRESSARLKGKKGEKERLPGKSAHSALPTGDWAKGKEKVSSNVCLL